MDQPDVDRVHREAIVIDGTCPLLNDEAYASWWIEGGATAAAPTVGAFEIAASAPGRIAVRYTAPYNCILQEGLFYEVALRYGASDATVAHAECRRRGHDACRFEIRY